MKTKLFYLTILLLFSGKNQAQFNVNSLLERIKHFDKFVHNLQYRQPNATGYRLDSITYNTYDTNTNSYNAYDRDVFTYNSNNYNTEWSYEMWNSANSSYSQESKTEYTYTASGMIESITRYNLVIGEGITPSNKFLYNYNSTGQLIEYIEQSYTSANGQFTNETKEAYSYAQTTDAFPNEIILYYWDGTNWVEQMKGTVTYTTSLLTHILVQAYSNGTWLNYLNLSRTYDTNNRLVLHLEELWNGTAWVNNSKTEYTYTETGNTLEITKEYYEWDNTATWFLHDKAIYVVNTQTQNIVQSEYYSVNTASTTLVGSSKNVYIYNTNEIEIDSYGWDTATQNWKTFNGIKNILTYDMGISKNSLVLPNKFREFKIIDMLLDSNVVSFDSFNHQLLSSEYFSRTGASDPWRPSYLENYYYTTVTSVDEHQQLSAKVYPNPFNKSIHFEIDADNFEINIYGLDGKLLYQANHQSNEIINLPFLNKGIYIYKLKTADGVASGELIKK